MQIMRLKDAPTDASYLFLVRLWRREAADEDSEHREWKGKVQHVRSGQAHGFDGLTALVEALQSLLGDLGPGSTHTADDPELYRSE